MPDAREGLGDMPQLGLDRAEKLASHRRVEEQIADFDGGPDRTAARHDGAGLAGDNLQLGPLLPIRGTADNQHPADFRDRGQPYFH